MHLQPATLDAPRDGICRQTLRLACRRGSQPRCNDQADPGDRGSRPILAAIEGQAFDQIAVLVIRWYGGIQLGTGGLARAHGGRARKCPQGGPSNRQRAPRRCARPTGVADAARRTNGCKRLNAMR